MNKENTEKLFNKYPKFFKDRTDPMKSLMCFGFECDDGWFDLINNLCTDIENWFLNNYEGTGYNGETYYHEVPDHFNVQQVKEKYGSLRFYVTCAPEKVFDMIHEAEKKSFYICEKCGKEGDGFYRDDLSWIITLCDDCLDEHILKKYGRKRKPDEDFISDWQKKNKAPFKEC